jgi:hypothetical protein
VRSRLNNPDAEANNTPQYKLLRGLDASGRLETILPYLKKVMKFVIVPQSFTYAPFQFLFTPLLISHAESYMALIFWGRFPSFAFSVLALLLMVLTWVRIREKNVFLLSATSMLLLGFSWENIIYARHMSSYAIGVFAGVALLYVFVLAIEGRNITIARGVLYGFLLMLISNMQYQVMYFIPAFFAVWFLDILLKKNSVKQFLWTAGSYAVCMLPTIVAFLIPKAHLNGAAFIGTSYNFQVPTNVGVFGVARYFYDFFVLNGLKIVRFITMYVPESNAFVSIITAVIVACMCFGVWRLVRSKDTMRNRIGLFLVTSLFLIAALAVRGRISLSPTRHALIYLPFVVLATSYGISELYEVLRTRSRLIGEFAVSLCIVLLVLLPFFASYREVVAGRKNQLSESMMQELVSRYEPAHVISDEADPDLYFVQPFKEWHTYQPGKRIYSVFENPDQRNKGVYMFVSANAIPSESCDKMLQSINMQSTCGAGSTLYEYYFNDNTPLDIAREANAIYNILSIKIIKI